MAEAALALRIFHLQSDQLVELPQLPDELPAKGFVWIGVARTALESALPTCRRRCSDGPAASWWTCTCPTC